MQSTKFSVTSSRNVQAITHNNAFEIPMYLLTNLNSYTVYCTAFCNFLPMLLFSNVTSPNVCTLCSNKIRNSRVSQIFNFYSYSFNQGNYGKSPIFFSITRNRDDVVREFLRRGAKVKIVNNKGQTPLSLAAGHLTEETVQLIEAAEEAQKDVCYCKKC